MIKPYNEGDILYPKENLKRIGEESDKRYWDMVANPSQYSEYEKLRILDER